MGEIRPEVAAAIRDYPRRVLTDPEAREFIRRHPEFAPWSDPDRERRYRNERGRRLKTYLLSLEQVEMVKDLSHRVSKRVETKAIRYAPLDTESAFRSAEDEALERLEPTLDDSDRIADFVSGILGSLKASQAELLDWHYLQGLSRGEISAKLGVCRSTVWRNMRAAKWAFVEAVARLEGPLPAVPTRGRPRRDRQATRTQAEEALRRRGFSMVTTA